MTFEKVQDLIAKHLQLSKETVKLESRLAEDLKADSANVMVLIMELEDLFNIEIADEAILTLKTVKDLVEYIDGKK